MKSMCFVVITVVGALSSSACHGGSPLVASSASPISLAAVSPSIGSTLAKGTTVDLTVTVRSTVDDPGRLTLALQDREGRPLLASEPSVAIGGRGSASLQASFTVPRESAAVSVIVSFSSASQIGEPVVKIFATYPTEWLDAG